MRVPTVAWARPVSKYFPAEYPARIMDWMQQRPSLGRMPDPERDAPRGQDLKSRDSRLQRPFLMLVAEDHDRFVRGDRCGHELRTIGQRAAILRVRRQDVHEHIAIPFPVVAEKAEQLHLDRPFPRGRLAETQVAPGARPIGISDRRAWCLYRCGAACTISRRHISTTASSECGPMPALNAPFSPDRTATGRPLSTTCIALAKSATKCGKNSLMPAA